MLDAIVGQIYVLHCGRLTGRNRSIIGIKIVIWFFDNVIIIAYYLLTALDVCETLILRFSIMIVRFVIV